MNATLARLLERHDLGEDEADALLCALADGSVAPELAAALLVALRAKGETPAELRGMARAMRRLALKPQVNGTRGLVDTCGTGGDGAHSLNLSTGAALLAAAAGAKVVKHGNRSVSSRAGSADCLEALGIALPADGAAAGATLAATGFTFLFAPAFHPAMARIAPVRRALGVRTVFNILGPLANPAEPPFQLVGAFSPVVARLIADALAEMPVERAFVVHGAAGWDEPTPIGPFTLHDVACGTVRTAERTPEAYGLPRCTPADLAGGSAEENAAALEHTLRGAPGAARDAIVLGAALVLELTGIAAAPRAAAAAAAAAIDDGRAGRLLDVLRGERDA